MLMPLKGITSQKAQIFNTKSTDACEFTPSQSIHFKIHAPRIKQRRLLCNGGKLLFSKGLGAGIQRFGLVNEKSPCHEETLPKPDFP
jgi:hypothetical protein